MDGVPTSHASCALGEGGSAQLYNPAQDQRQTLAQVDGLLRLSSLFDSGDDGTDQGKGPVCTPACCRTQHTDADHQGLLCILPTQCHQT